MAKFIRKNIDPNGTYNLAYKTGINPDTGLPEITQSVVIEGRSIYSTDDKKLIDILRKDPEILEVNKNATIESNED